jgi:hypothetical protein
MARNISPDYPWEVPEKESPSLGSRHHRDRSEPNEISRVNEDSRPGPEQQSSEPREPLDTPLAYYLGRNVYLLRGSEVRALAAIGTFRTVLASDLDRFVYGGDTRRMERELRRLRDVSLVSEHRVPVSRESTARLFALTRQGARLAQRAAAVPEEQVLFHRLVRPREANHDALLYRLYHAEARRIAEAGGRVTRVVLDYELKSELNRELAALSPGDESGPARETIARRHGLAVVDGKILVPDMRIEYDTADMERARLDLELATRNYRPQALARKARAGFSFYAPRRDASGLRRTLDEHDIAAAVLSL